MTIEKLPSGSYRIRQQYDGKRYSITVDHKPTKKEATILLSERFQNMEQREASKTFRSCSAEYITLKRNVLSPSTITGYTRYERWLSEQFMRLNIYDITQIDIQTEISNFAVSHSPKSVRNLHGYISAVLKLFRPNMSINTTLPQKQKREAYVPEDNIIKLLMNDCKDTQWEVPAKLGCYGLRRSEICALDISDLNDNHLTINKAMILNSDNEYVIKETTKTDGSARTVYIDNDLAELIREQGFVFKGYPCSITDYMTRFQKKYNLKGFSFHKLRHYYATMLHDLGVPDSDIMKLGGWSSDYVMKNVYRHSVQNTMDNAQLKAVNHLTKLY